MELLNNITEAQFEVIYFLSKYTMGSWTFNKETGLVDIKGDFICKKQGLKDFKGVRFGVVTGDFRCSYNDLISLEGAPQKVGKRFFCSGNKLTSLEGAPQVVGSHLDCTDNKLTSLKGAPQKVGGDFSCFDNELTSLVGAPQKVGGDFFCNDNYLTSLEGAPQEVGGDFFCNDNPISSNTLKLVWNTMEEKKIDYWTALVILKNNIWKNDFDKLEGELDKRIPKDTQKGISMMGRFGHFD